jgi:hypothetical protein
VRGRVLWPHVEDHCFRFASGCFYRGHLFFVGDRSLNFSLLLFEAR